MDASISFESDRVENKGLNFVNDTILTVSKPRDEVPATVDTDYLSLQR